MSHILRAEVQQPEVIQAPIIADIYRFDPAYGAKGTIQRYTVPYRRRMSIFTLLREIYGEQDATLAFRNQQCGRGICGTCRVRVDLDRLGFKNKSVKGCCIPLLPGDHLVIHPSMSRVIRDLVVEF